MQRTGSPMLQPRSSRCPRRASVDPETFARLRTEWDRQRWRVEPVVRQRGGNVCAACGNAGLLTVDHVVSLARGGTNHLGNLALLCPCCNSAKGERATVPADHLKDHLTVVPPAEPVSADGSRWVTLAEAAREIGVSLDTMRRRARRGEMRAERRATPSGFVWYVCIGERMAPAEAPTQIAQVQSEALLEALRLVDRLQQQNMELAGMVGALQQRLVFADERIRALEAPREPTPAEIAPGEPTDGLAVETSTAPPRPERPWWLRWLPA